MPRGYRVGLETLSTIGIGADAWPRCQRASFAQHAANSVLNAHTFIAVFGNGQHGTLHGYGTLTLRSNNL
eukprot:11205268-Lingulodinium_polyedra.AAC.1